MFPAVKKPKLKPSRRTSTTNKAEITQPPYPCGDWRDTKPPFYCAACDAEWAKSVVPLWETGIAPVLRRAGISITTAEIAGKLGQEAYERAFEAIQTEKVDGLIVVDAPDLVTDSQVIVRLAAKYGLPTMYPHREYVEDGGLLSYGIDRAEMYRRLATDQVLRGASLGDIPYEQQTKFELLLNRKTARSLGLDFPPTLLAAAGEVIE